MSSPIKVILHRCELVLVYTAVAAAFAMMLLTSADALSRYLLNSPILGAYEITEKYLIVAMVFLGLSYAYRGGVFIRVTFLIDRLPRNWRIAADHFSHAISIFYSLIFLVATARQAWRALSDATTMSVLPVLIGPAYCMVPLGFLALAMLMLVDLPRVREGRALLFAQEGPES
ncbi:MAG TPA: TRAP transporter small permease [Xanthobacteraceae bacterium]|jgi:TRAP-type C4-dicarboxylate transport system permease small subunit|nr:TRAP transporter small permease [Xanthobacteraceae bacterium]